MTKEEAEVYLSTSAIQDLSLEAAGAYNQLMAIDRKDGSIASDLETLAKRCGVTRKRMESVFWPVLSQFFVPAAGISGRLVSPANELLRAKDAGKSQVQSARAKERWRQYRENAGADAAAVPGDMPRHESGSAVASAVASGGHTEPPKKEEFPPHTPLSEEKITPTSLADDLPAGYSADFEAFWRLYPLKEGKGAAFKAWKKLRPSARMQEIIAASIDVWKGSKRWKDGIVAHASTWLNERRWDDSPEQAPAGPPPKTNNPGPITNPNRQAILDRLRELNQHESE